MRFDSSGIPKEVIDYLQYFRRCVEDNDTAARAKLYQTGWTELTERFFNREHKSDWPSPEQVSEIKLRADQVTEKKKTFGGAL